MSQPEAASTNNIEPIRSVVACHFPLLREGISKIPEDNKNIDMVSRVSNLFDLIQFCEEHEFEILLLDVDLRGINLERIPSLTKKNRAAKVILIMDNDYNKNLLINTIMLGVSGESCKGHRFENLIKLVAAMYSGELWVEWKLMGKALDGSAYPSRTVRGKREVYDLTETEIKIIKLVLTVYTNKGVADEHYISEKIVKFHLYKVFKKLKAKKQV